MNKPRSEPQLSAKVSLPAGDLDAIVIHYRGKYQECAAQELRFFAIQPTLSDAMEKAAVARRPDGKRLSHQRRIPRSVLASCLRRLRAVGGELAAAGTFADLFAIVDREIRPIHGIGELTVYDTALRIAAWRRLEPEAVYLHAGTRHGAKALGLDVRRPFIPIRELPRALRRLRPHEIEDVLCIYKDIPRRNVAVGTAAGCN